MLQEKGCSERDLDGTKERSFNIFTAKDWHMNNKARQKQHSQNRRH
jgi:hypothetical protein